MNAPLTRRAILSATAAAAAGAMSLPALAEAGIPVSVPAPHPDAALFALLDAFPAALAEADAAEAVSADLWDAFMAQEPPRPEALFWRHDDHFPGVSAFREMLPTGRWALLYDARAVHDLREAPPPVVTVGWRVTEERPTLTVPDERRIARRAEILAAHDAWWAECQAIRERLGLPAADAAELAVVERLDALTASILATPPRTTAGLGAKAKWASREELSAPTRAAWSARLLADVIALAESGWVVS